MDRVRIGIIGGSGLYQMPELKDVEEIKIDTPFGSPSDAFIVGTLDDERVFSGKISFEDLIISIAKMSRANDESARKSDRL